MSCARKFVPIQPSSTWRSHSYSWLRSALAHHAHACLCAWLGELNGENLVPRLPLISLNLLQSVASRRVLCRDVRLLTCTEG